MRAFRAPARIARPDPSLRNEPLLGMTCKLHHCQTNAPFAGFLG